MAGFFDFVKKDGVQVANNFTPLKMSQSKTPGSKDGALDKVLLGVAVFTAIILIVLIIILLKKNF